jgi:type IV secretion system protein VirB1
MLDLPALYAEQESIVDPSTTAAVVRRESRGDPLAIGVNGPGGGARRTATFEQACEVATALIRSGRSVDLGLMQLNWSAGHLQRRGLAICDAFDPRTNIRVGTQVLWENYGACRQRDQRACLVEALSKYNTGHRERGVANGYVAGVLGQPLLVGGPRSAPAPPRRPDPREAVERVGPEWHAAIAMTLGDVR